MNLHHVFHSGANTKYYVAVLGYIQKDKSNGITVSKASLGEFIDKGTPAGTDVLSYQTFPDEHNPKKFNPAVILKSDNQFHAFEGRKILIDTHDCGDKDAFSRMADGRHLPRVKCYPTDWFLKNFNVVLVSSVSANPGVFPDKFNRFINISCKFGKREEGFYGHTIRESVKRYLRESFSYHTDFTWVKDKTKYFQELQWTNIVVGAPGWGRHNASYWGAFKAGAMLFAHRSLNDIKLFPHADLVDGDDYVSYDLFNFKAKLRRVLFDVEEMDRVRNNGRRKFAAGLNYKKSANQLVKFLKGE
jgi:hypothetical protein